MRRWRIAVRFSVAPKRPMLSPKMSRAGRLYQLADGDTGEVLVDRNGKNVLRVEPRPMR